MSRRRDELASYPFLATRTQAWWRNAVTEGVSVATHPSTVVKLPKNPTIAKNSLAASVSNQQALAVRYLRNSMALSYASGGISVFHLGGLPGAGKTAIVKELIAELNDSKLIDTESNDILLCSKSNSAKASLMSACETGKKGLYPARSFATLNSGFSIPVVHNRNEVTDDRVNRSADWLKRKILDFGLGNLQFLVIDEYTMSSCREIVYIDAILRMIKFRPDIPFGGVFVLFLGDNRQNSAVVQDSNNGVQRKKVEPSPPRVGAGPEEEEDHKEEEEGFRRGGVEDEFDNNNVKLYTDLFIKIMKNFASKDCFGRVQILKKTINDRLSVLMKKEQCVASTNNDIILACDRGVKPKKVEKSNEDEFDDDDEIFSEDLLLQIMDGTTTTSSPPSTIQHDSFSMRCKNVAEANIALKKREKEQLEWGKATTTMDIVKGAPLSAVVEEGLKSEIEHLKCLKSMSETDLEHYARAIFNEIIKTATKAMVEIDYSGREKFFIVSSLSERFKDAHVTALMDEEILNAKLLFGHDKKCCDALPFKSAQRRSLAIAACVRNAFIRDGCEIKAQIPIAKYFRENLHQLAEFLQDDVVSYKEMVEKSMDINKRLLEENKQQPKKIDDQHNDMVEEDYFCDDGEEEGEERAVSRPDVPQEVNADSSTNERVGVLVSFHVTWYEWLSSTQPSDLVRSRIWHLYMLVRMQQADNKLPSFDKAAASGRLFFPNWSERKEHHDEYWLRILSMPVSAGGDTQQSLLLPAYSSYLSAISRTYIMSSLKRVNAVKHSYALMYGVSLLDMTIDVNELVDSRQVPCLSKPIGYDRELDVEEYFGTIFRYMVDEYLMHRSNDVIAETRSVEEAKGSLKVSALLAKNLNNSQAARNGGALRFTNKSVILAMRMLTSIAQGNMRSELMKKETEEDSPPEAKSLKQSLADRFASKTATAAKHIDENRRNRMIGAITLTRSHAQKNAVSHLVDATIINQSKSTANSIKTTKSVTKFVVKNIDVSYMSPETSIRSVDMGKILEAIRHSASLNKPFIDSATDHRLLKESQNPRKFTKILTDLRNKVTHVKSVNLYQGQNVIFTNTNVKQIHGTTERFVTKDTGVIIDIVVKNGVTTVFVLVERLGKNAIPLTKGRHFWGDENDKDGPRNAYVEYIPLDSSQAMTIYSCQGQTFCRDTIVDLTGASAQDAYVAITRNNDPLNLYVVQTHETERRNLSNIKCSTGKDKACLLPLGGVGKLGGEEFVNYDAINVAKEVLGSVIAAGDDGDEEKSCHYSSFDPTRDTVTAAQRFILSRSGNALAFNSTWMVNTSKILLKDGLSAELDRIDEFFFGPGKSEYAKYYTDATNDKIMELFTAVTRSVTHYAVASGTHIKTPSLNLMEDHIEKHKNKKDYVKIHPCFLNASPMKDSLSSLFYDVAPHSKTAAVLQFYTHYLFLVYEQLHICNSSFAFLSSTSPVLNQHTRPDFENRSVQLPTSCTIYIPGGGLGYESRDFKESKDGGARDEILRVPLTTLDHLGDNTETLRKTALASLTSYDEEKVAMCTEYIGKSMQHNLRRPGKFCRPHETCGLSKHGAIVAATKSEKIEESHVHENEKGWISLSNEVNMYGLLVFMTNLAAASGVTAVKLNEDGDILEPKEGRCGPVFAPLEDCGAPAEYQLRLSEEILWCGQVTPMQRVQFTLHARVNQAVKAARLKTGKFFGTKIFSSIFEKEVLKGKKLKGAQVVMITEMVGRDFAQHATSAIRSSLFHGVGKVIAKKTIDNNVIGQTEDFIITKLKTTACVRASFFVSLKY